MLLLMKTDHLKATLIRDENVVALFLIISSEGAFLLNAIWPKVHKATPMTRDATHTMRNPLQEIQTKKTIEQQVPSV